MSRKRDAYPTDLSDAEWEALAPLVPPVKPGGRPAVHERREVVNALAYWLRAGCAWWLLPHDLPPWRTVYHYWRMWRIEGRWEQITTVLRERERSRQGRHPLPSAGIVDSRRVKTTEKGAARLRRRQEGRRLQTSPARRHARDRLQGARERG